VTEQDDAAPVQVELDLLEQRVGPRGNRDLVLALLVDDDRRDAGGDAVEPPHAAHVDALGGQLAQGLVAEVVGADRADHRDPRARPRRGHRLVGALAAAVAREGAPGDRLAGAREPADRDHEVGVDGPHHHDGRLRHGRRG
jgi:hypothetical protein